MPKKTKKEKLLALYHKKIRLLENQPATNSTVLPKISSSVPIPIVNQEVKEEKQTHHYFFSDLRKSLILIAVIIGLEISLYFAKLFK